MSIMTTPKGVGKGIPRKLPKIEGWNTFSATVNGDHMEPALFKGDRIYTQKVDHTARRLPTGRDVTVAFLDGTEVLARLHKVKKGDLYLYALNPKYPDPYIVHRSFVNFIGVVFAKHMEITPPPFTPAITKGGAR